MSLEDFEFGKELGKGAFGSVSIVRRIEDNKIYAMKRVKIGLLGKKEKDNSFNEVRLLASLDHKNIIGYKEAFFDDKSKTLNIVMEYADGGDLSTKIKEYRKKNIYFEEREIWSTLIQILEGLKYLHQSCIIHRDLKSANIFLTKNGCVKIGDLNVSKILNRMRTASTQTGTPYFASPEIWNDQPYDYKCDIWSVGCIIYEMCALHVPFRGTSMQNLYQNVLRGIYQQISMKYSDDLRKIIKQILVVNPKNRPSSSELLENPIIKRKIVELGLNKDNKKKNEEKARLMKTIKIPMNMSHINNELPQKKYENEKMLLNDEYETAKRTFYNPPTNNNDNNINNYKNFDNKIDNNKINNENNNNNNNSIKNNNLNNINLINNNQIDDKNFIEKLLVKDLNNIQNIIKNIDNNNNIRNNYINNNPNKNNSKSFKNIDIPEEQNKKSIILNGKNDKSDNNKYLHIEEPNRLNLNKYNPKIRDHNKYSNINYDYILNEKDSINRIIKTDMNQINQNNNINTNNPFIKNDEIIKTEISNIDTNFKKSNNNISQIKEKEKDKDKEKEKNNQINNIKNDINNKIDKNNEQEQDIEFKEKYYKLMDEINKNALLKNENKNEKNNTINNKNNNNIYQDNNNININTFKNNKIKDIEEEILKSKKELEVINRNINLLEQNNKHKKELKYNKSDNRLSSNINLNNNINNYNYNYINNRNSKKKFINDINFTEKANNNNNINNNNNYERKTADYMYRQKEIKRMNNQIFDMNLKRNYRQHNRNTMSLRPHNFNNDINNERSSLNLNNKSNIVKSNNNKNLYEKNSNYNKQNRYNIFINYRNSNYNKQNNNNNNYHYRNNYYFNNCNFINNNANDNNYQYKYNNNNYLRNPYNNNNYYNNYNQFYKDYFNNFINYLSLKKQKEENNNNNNKNDNLNNNKYMNNDVNNANNVNNENKKIGNKNSLNKLNEHVERPYILNTKFKIDNEPNMNNKRKIIYEKIDFQKQGNKYNYFKGQAHVRYVGNGNYYNQCHKEIIKNPIIINPAKQYGIQNLLLSGGKPNRNGPRIILPRNMVE